MYGIIKNYLLYWREIVRAVGLKRLSPTVYENNSGKLGALAGRHLNERAFIIGNGPSINKQNLNLLENEITFACNSFFLKFDDISFRPNYYVVEDKLVAQDNSRKLSALNVSEKFVPWDLRRWIKPDDMTTYVDFRRFTLSDTDPRFPLFGTDATKSLYWGGTVLYLAIQLAAYMRCNPIYLIGVDLNYTIPKSVVVNGNKLTSVDDDINHFHPDYFGKGKRWHLPKPERMGHCFGRAAKFLERQNVCIYNATEGGNLHTVPRIKYEDLF